MFLFAATTVALSFLGPLVNAQSTNDTALGISAIEAHFTNAQLVPALLASFSPSALFTVTFSGVGAISPGQNLSVERESLSLSHPILSLFRLRPRENVIDWLTDGRVNRGGRRARAHDRPREL
jgi:hypothetical protein